jgi:hypothetical protein
MKYDDASWHYEGDFPADLPREAGATHTGMFIAWALLSGLGSDALSVDAPDDIEQLRARSITPGQFFMRTCDGKFTDETLSEVGNQFVAVYFDMESADYLSDYETTVGGDSENLYSVPDNWTTFDRLKPVLDSRFAKWRGTLG